jgi:hypothetical protein
MKPDDTMVRPRSVTWALVLLGGSWAISMVMMAWRLFITRPLINGEPTPVWAAIVATCIVGGIGGGLFAALVYRRRWAYYVYIVLLALGAVSVVSDVGNVLARGPLYVTYYVALQAAQIAGVVLLLRRPGRKWYGAGRRATPPGEWRADPWGRHQHRYWDGGGWTDHVADEGVTALDPIEEFQV